MPCTRPPETLDHSNDEAPALALRSPVATDAAAMWRIARDSGGLDLNSPYAYVLVGDHFAETSLVAETGEGALVAFVAAYRPPTEPDAVFVWQVAVDHAHRGTGLARRMLHAVVDRAQARGARHLTATVTPGNDASRRLFRAVAGDRDVDVVETPLYDASLFAGTGDVSHEPENQVRIGPLTPA